MSTVVLLGPQRPSPILGPTLRPLGIGGPFAVVTAGLQEREGEIGDLEQHLGGRISDLWLYRRAEDVFRRDPRFARAYRQRQTRLKERQRFYRIRLAHALAAVRELAGAEGDPSALAHARAQALAAVRTLDRQHLREVRRVHAEFEADWRPAAREVIVGHRAEVAASIRNSAALLIAGGHVAVLINRLRLFAIDEAIGDRHVIAWSAGAMAIAERIVLYHDHPPQGPGDPEVLDHGVGLVGNIVPLPDARHRLATNDRVRVRLFASRFAPARCLTFDQGSCLCVSNGNERSDGVRILLRNGSVSELAAS